MARIFLSHSSANNAEAIALRDWLIHQGWDDLFLDLDPERGLKAGNKWQQALKEAAERCELVIFLLSPEWVDSPWCKAEFLHTNQMGKRIMGVIVKSVPFNDIPGEMTNQWQLVDLTAGPQDYERIVKLPPDAKTQTIPKQKVSFWRGGLERVRIGLMSSGLDARYFEWPPKDDPERAPYPGLRALQEEDAGIFFGREGPVVEAMVQLKGLADGPPPRFLVILGASGAGKSSFMRAGLLPRLKRDHRFYHALPVVRPEKSVLSHTKTGFIAALETALKAADIPHTRAEIRKSVEGGAETLQPLLQKLAAKVTPVSLKTGQPAEPPLLILPIDQGEELFLADGAKEAGPFLDLLRDLLSADHPAIAVLVTIRSDNYEQLQSAKQFEKIHQHTLSLPPMPQGNYSQVINGPAARLEGTDRALDIEPQLVEALQHDIEAGGGKDALPLLAFTLERLYEEHGGDGDLKLSEYEELGKIRGSIEAAVENAMQAADDNPGIPKDEKARLSLMRRALIPWLAGIDPDSGAPRRRVAKLSEIPPEARPLMELLVDQRLLATDVDKDSGEKTIEPAHEALLRQWSLLEGWLDEDFEELATLEGVKRASRDWHANDKDAEWLAHAGGRLEAAEKVVLRQDLAATLSTDERTYLATAREAEQARKEKEAERQRLELEQARKLAEASKQAAEASKKTARRTRVGMLVAIALAFVAGGLGWWAIDQQQVAEKQKEIAIAEAKRAERQTVLAKEREVDALNTQSFFLGDLSNEYLVSQDASTASLLALAGLPDKSAGYIRPYIPEVEFDLYSSWMANRELAVFAGHEEKVTSAAISPDGKQVMTTSENRLVRVWNATSGRQLLTLKGHGRDVKSAIFNSKGTRILTASFDKTARLWNATSGRELVVLKGHKDGVNSAHFNSNGTRILTASRDNTARLWDAASGKQLTIFKGHENSVTSAVFSSDGKQVLTASWDKTARLWDTASGKQLTIFKGHTEIVNSAVFSFDSTRVLTASSSDKTARLWDTTSGKQLVIIKGPRKSVVSAVLSPDGRHIATASYDDTVRIWDAANGAQLAVLKGHKSNVSSVVFSPEGGHILTASEDKTARLWDAASGAQLAVLKGHGDDVLNAVFSRDGNRALTASRDKTARLWNIVFDQEPAALKGHTQPVISAVFNSDATRILTASWDDTARLWEVSNGKQLTILGGHEASLSSALFSPNGKFILTASADSTARLWDAVGGQELFVLKGHDGKIVSAVFSPDGKRVLTASDGGVTRDFTARLWDTKSGRQLVVFKGHESGLNSATFSPDGKRVLTASGNLGTKDFTARLWDAESGKQFVILKGHKSPVHSAVFSPDGTHVLTSSWDRTARLWNATNGQELVVLSGHQDKVTKAIFNTDGTRILTAGWDKSPRIWDASTGEQIAILAGHHTSVQSAVFSADSKRVLTASSYSVRIWDAVSGKQVAVLEDKKGIFLNAVFDPNAARILIGTMEGDVVLWRAFPDTQSLVDYIKQSVPRCLTQKQLKKFNLPSTPPRWCIAGSKQQKDKDHTNWHPKYPYHSVAWRDWLIARDKGEEALLPPEITTRVLELGASAEHKTNSGQYNEALDNATQAVVWARKPGGGQLNLVIALFIRGKIYDAIDDVTSRDADFAEVQRLGLGNLIVDYLISKGNKALKSKTVDSALASMTEAISWARKSDGTELMLSEALLARGKAYDQKGDTAARDADFAEAQSLGANVAGFFVSKGDKARKNKNYDDAIIAYNKALSLNPGLKTKIDDKLAGTYNIIAWRAFEAVALQGKPVDTLKSVLDHATKAIVLNPKDHNAYDTRGQILFQLKRFDEAFADFEKNFERGGKYSAASYARGRIHEQRSNLQAAIADYRTAIKQGAGNDAYAKKVLPDAKKRLKALEARVAAEKPAAADVTRSEQ